jgi:hypothetical protein
VVEIIIVEKTSLVRASCEDWKSAFNLQEIFVSGCAPRKKIIFSCPEGELGLG